MTTREAYRYMRRACVLMDCKAKVIYLPSKPGWRLGPTGESILAWLLGHGWRTA